MKFIEDVHKYINEGTEFVPVTTFLKSFQEKQDWDAIAEKKAKKDGVSKEELLAQWEDKRNKAAQKGTAFHKMMEEKYQEDKWIEEDGDRYQVHWVPTIDGIKEDQQLVLEDGKIYTEKMVWSNTYKICGTADLVEVKRGRIHVKDYKTNEKLEFSAWKHPNPAIGTKKLLSPVNTLDDCNGNIYYLQLNLYMYMLLKHNRHLKMGTMEILHITYDEQGKANKPIRYPVPNLQRQIELMLKSFSLKQTVEI